MSQTARTRHGRGSISSVAESQATTKDTPHLKAFNMSQDPLYVSRLKTKLCQTFTEPGPNGTTNLTSTFLKMDRKIRGDLFAYVDLWGMKNLFSPYGFSDLEIEVLFALFLQEDDAIQAFLEAPEAQQQGSQYGGRVSSAASNYTGSRGTSRRMVATIDVAEVMMSLRKMFHNVSYQFHEIMKRIRSKRLDPTTITPSGKPFCSFYVAYQRTGEVASKQEIFDFLTKAYDITDSEAFLCLEYFALASTSASTSGKPEDDDDFLQRENSPCSDGDSPMQGEAPSNGVDMSYVCAVLFEFPLPDDIAFPLLMSKFVESITDPNRNEKSGISCVLEELLFCTEEMNGCGNVVSLPCKQAPSMEELERLESVWGAEDTELTPPYVAALKSRWLDKGLFRRVCIALNVGLPTAEQELLFSYLFDPNCGLLCTETLVSQILVRMPRIPPTELRRFASSVRTQLTGTGRGPHGLNILHGLLAKYADRPVPPLSLVRTLWSLGVTSAPTVMIDAIRLAAQRCVPIVSFICGPVPPARREVIQKLFSILQEDSGVRAKLPQGTVVEFDASVAVPKSSVLRRFQPEMAAGLVSKEAMTSWRTQLEGYLGTLPDSPQEGGEEGDYHRQFYDSVISFEEFVYYWGNVGASIDDDSQFTMLLWKTFAMHKGGGAHLAVGGMNGERERGPIVVGNRTPVQSPPQQRVRRMLR